MYSGEVIAFAREHVGESLVGVSSRLVDEISAVIVNAIQSQIGQRKLASNLYHAFKGVVNYDWDMIAATEIGNIVGNGSLIAELNRGTRYLRGNAAGDACDFCKNNVDRKIVVIGHSPNESGFVYDGRLKKTVPYVWPAKNNFDREHWWVASGVQHSWCNCWWSPYLPEFDKWDKKVDEIVDRLHEERS